MPSASRGQVFWGALVRALGVIYSFNTMKISKRASKAKGSGSQKAEAGLQGGVVTTLKQDAQRNQGSRNCFLTACVSATEQDIAVSK